MEAPCVNCYTAVTAGKILDCYVGDTVLRTSLGYALTHKSGADSSGSRRNQRRLRYALTAS
jgi:hypothetical protein